MVALAYALPITLFILALFYYWFAIADRYAIFLYGHLGAAPFEDMTSSRYWMSGLVASGAVLIPYTAANGLLGHSVARYRAPAWWRVWLLCALPLAIGISIITLTANSPTLSPALAAACVGATLAGLALALMPGALAAHQPRDLALWWLALDGLGLVPILLLLRAVELPGRGLVSTSTAYLVAVGGILFGAIWLGATSVLHARQHKPPPRTVEIFAAGLCWSYLILPLAHHLLATPAQYRYITTASNFFAFNPALQFVVFLIAAGLAAGATRFRQSLRRTPTPLPIWK